MAGNSSTAAKSFLTDNVFTRFFREVIGPAAVVAAGMIGAGAVATRLLAGAWFGTSLLWVALYIIPMVIFTLDSASRVCTLTGRGMVDMIKTEITPILAWALFIPTILLNLMVNMSQFSIMLDSTYGMVGLVPPTATGVTAGGIIVTLVLLGLTLTLVLWGGYKRLEKSMTWLLMLILVCFIVVALKAFLDWRTWVEAARGLIPQIPASLPIAGTDPVQYRPAFTQLMSIAGQGLASTVFLTYGYFSVNANYTTADLKASFRKTVINLGVIWGLFSVMVVVAGYFALNIAYQGSGAAGDLHFSQISTITQAGQVLTPAMPGFMAFLAGPIFSLGLFAAAFTTLISVAMTMVYFSLDIIGKDWKITQENVPARVLLGLWIAVPALLAPFWHLDALLKAILSMAGNLILAPIIVLIIWYFVTKKKYVGEYTAGFWRNLVLAITFVFSLCVVAYGLVTDLIPKIQSALH